MWPHTQAYIYLKRNGIFLFSLVFVFLVCSPGQRPCLPVWLRDVKGLDAPVRRCSCFLHSPSAHQDGPGRAVCRAAHQWAGRGQAQRPSLLPARLGAAVSGKFPALADGSESTVGGGVVSVRPLSGVLPACLLFCSGVTVSFALLLLRGLAYFFTFRYPSGIHRQTEWSPLFLVAHLPGSAKQSVLSRGAEGLQAGGSRQASVLSLGPRPWMPSDPICFPIKLPPPAPPEGHFPFRPLASLWTKTLFLVPLLLTEKG